MVYMVRSGEWYRVGSCDGVYELEGDNPSEELFGQMSGGVAEEAHWRARMHRFALEEKGRWYRLGDDFVRECMNEFVPSDELDPSVDIRKRYDRDAGGSQARIVMMYEQMSSWYAGSGIEGGRLWSSLLLGRLEVLKAVGSGVFRVLGDSSLKKGLDVRYFDGRVWSVVPEAELRVSLQYFCLNDMRIGAGDWVRHERKFVDAVYDGARLSPLRLSRSIVGFRNGVFDFSDLGNVVYHPFEDRMPVVDLLPYDYDLTAGCPMWESYLSSILDAGQISLLQRFLGLGLADRRSMPYKVESSLWLVGPGGAGKSTIMNVVMHVLGEKSFSSITLGGLLDGGAENRARFLATAVGKVFNYCGEIQVSDMTRNVDSFKSLCSGEPQSIRRIGGNVETAYDIPYLIFNMNKKPKNSSIDHAVRRRMLFITFRTAIRECDKDPRLAQKLMEEASGIRNWMLAGYRAFVADGGILSPTRESLEETDLWMAENGQTAELFMQKSGYRAFGYTGRDEKGEYVAGKILYDEYYRWCQKRGIDPDVDVRGFGRELRSAGYRSRRVAAGVQYMIFRD